MVVLQKGHEEEISRMREGYVCQIERLSDQIIALQGELNKMKTLAGIDKLTQVGSNTLLFLQVFLSECLN